MSFPLLPDALREPIRTLPGVTLPRADLLARLNIHTIGDLLAHFPRTYEDLTDVRPIARLEADTLLTTQGEVVEIDGRRLADGRTVVRVVLGDGLNCVEGTWFNQPWMAQRFRYGQKLGYTGKARWYRDHWQMNNPRVQVLDGKEAESAGIVPVYPLTEDLRAETLRMLLRHAVERYADDLAEVIPAELRQRWGLPAVAEALRQLHFPPTLQAAQNARRRFIYEELLLLQVALALRRREIRDRQRAAVLRVTPLIDQRIRRRFPFPLTSDQDRVIAEICRDLAGDRPMQRLLQADVGAGKTAVAVYVMLVAIANKHQSVLMAPTEVLARQHMTTLDRYLADSQVRRLLLTGGLSPRQRRESLERIGSGEVDLVVGTQALLQDDVQFARLGVVVIDEQHKFGVNQRARIRRLGSDPHYLVMTATPIPRTLALTVFGDLDVSIIRQLPPGRQPVATRWLRSADRPAVLDKIRNGLRQGQQAYVVCPLVDESETSDLKTAEQTYEELRTGPFAQFRVGILHGRMDDAAKDAVMDQFRRHEIDLLVTTVVIEVGIDVPNATLLLVEHADRFGLSQLHQLRGRVSRGCVAGQCWLFAEPTTDEARERLRIICRTTDGFELAEHDFKLRGLGEFFGTRQHGVGDLRIADIFRDQPILAEARQDAFALVHNDPGLRHPDHALLRRAVLERYGQSLDLAEIG
jgi:ATP-dependent DNA helicase RecG